MKKIYILSAVLLAGLAACQNVETPEEVTVPSKTYTLSVTADKGDFTRALELAKDEKTVLATWGAGEKVAVVDYNSHEILGELSPKTTGDASTVLTGDISGITDPAAGQQFYLLYPSPKSSGALINEDCPYTGQLGDLVSLSKKYDYATCGMEIESVTPDGDIVGKEVSFYNRQAIVKFSFFDENKEPIVAQKITLSTKDARIAQSFWFDNQDDFVWGSSLEVQPANPQEAMYVAVLMKGIDSAKATDIDVTVETADGEFTKTIPSDKLYLNDGYYYRVGLVKDPVVQTTWYISGTMNDDGWNSSWAMDEKSDGIWASEVEITADDEFKIHNDEATQIWVGGPEFNGPTSVWSPNGTYVPVIGTAFTYSTADGSPNFRIGQAGKYNVTLDLNAGTVLIEAVGGSEPVSWFISGTMNGDTNWSNSLAMSETSKGIWKYEGLVVTADDEFKVHDNGSTQTWYGGPEANVSSSMYDGETCFAPTVGTAFALGDKNIRIGVAGTYNVTLNLNDSTVLIEAVGGSEPESVDVTLYFGLVDNSPEHPHLYVWYWGASNTLLGSWPGPELTDYETINGIKYYSKTISTKVGAEIGVIINNGNGGKGNQSGDFQVTIPSNTTELWFDVTWDFTITQLTGRPGIKIDGDMSDWASVKGVTEGTHTFKITSDKDNIYLYSKRSREGRWNDIWGGTGYIYFGFDLDNNSETGDGEKSDWGTGKWETLILTYPYAGSSTTPEIASTTNDNWWVLPAPYTIANIAFKGVVGADGAELEFSIPRADIAAIPASEITVNAWGNKDLSRAILKCTL